MPPPPRESMRARRAHARSRPPTGACSTSTGARVRPRRQTGRTPSLRSAPGGRHERHGRGRPRGRRPRGPPWRNRATRSCSRRPPGPARGGRRRGRGRSPACLNPDASPTSTQISRSRSTARRGRAGVDPLSDKQTSEAATDLATIELGSAVQGARILAQNPTYPPPATWRFRWSFPNGQRVRHSIRRHLIGATTRSRNAHGRASNGIGDWP